MSKDKEMDKELEQDQGVEIPIEGEDEEVNVEETVEEAEAEVDQNEEEVSAEAETHADTEADAEEASSEESSSDAEMSSETETSSEEDDPWQTKYMRLMADFQNYKKRTAKEVSDIRSSASEKVMTKILDVLDNFERAFEQGTTDEKYAEGVENIFKQLLNVLGQNGLEEMEVLGAEFDPNFHNAAVMEDTEEYESGKISGVIQKGYTLNGKVIRPPMVKVAK